MNRKYVEIKKVENGYKFFFNPLILSVFAKQKCIEGSDVNSFYPSIQNHRVISLRTSGAGVFATTKIKLMATLFLGLTGMSFQIHTHSPLLNEKAPVFKAQAVFPPDHKIGEFDLKKYIGHHKIVLYFYPMDSTPGCSKQAEKFRDDIARLQDHGIIVIGISCDSLSSHQKFQEKYKLPFILVHDSRWYRKISKMYDAAGWFYSKRKTYLIDKDGVVVHVFEKVDIKNQIDEILEVFGR